MRWQGSVSSRLVDLLGRRIAHLRKTVFDLWRTPALCTRIYVLKPEKSADRAHLWKDVDDAVGVGEIRADDRPVELQRHIDATKGNAFVQRTRARQALGAMFGRRALDDWMQGNGVRVIDHQDLLAMHVMIERRFETTRGRDAILPTNGRHFSVANSIDGAIAARQAQQRRVCAQKVSMGVENENSGVDLVDNHVRHVAVVV